VNDARVPARSDAVTKVTTPQLVTTPSPNQLLWMRLPRVAPSRVLNRRRSRRIIIRRVIKSINRISKLLGHGTAPYKYPAIPPNLSNKDPKKNAHFFLCVLDRASSWYLNKGWPTGWHLLYYILLNMFQTLIRRSSGASEYLLCCAGWLEACWCYVAGLSSAYTRIPHHQQTIPLHNTSTPQVSLHNTTSTR